MWKTRSAVRPTWQAFEMEGEGNLGARSRARKEVWGIWARETAREGEGMRGRLSAV